MASIDEMTTVRCRSPRASTVIYQQDRRATLIASRTSHRYADTPIPHSPMSRRVDNILSSLAPSPFLQSTTYYAHPPGPPRQPTTSRDSKPLPTTPSNPKKPHKQPPSSISSKSNELWSWRRTSTDSSSEGLLTNDHQQTKTPASQDKRKGLAKLRFRKAKPKIPTEEAEVHIVEVPPHRHHTLDRSLPPTPRSNDHGPHAIPSVIDVTPPASPARRHHVGDLSKVARQMGGVLHIQSGSENTSTVMQGDHSPRPVDGLLTPTPHSTPWRNSLTSDRSVSPMSFSPPTPIQRTASTPIDSQGDDYPSPPTPHARSTAFSSNTEASSSETGSSIISEVNEHPSSASPNTQIDLGEQSDSESATLHTDSDGHETIHEGDKYPAASLKSAPNESEIHYTRPRTPFGEYLLSDEKQHAQPAEVSFRWLHDLGQDEEGVIVIVREPVTDIWSGEWNIALHDVISAIRFL
ncbi:hypothetical protein BKA70DRAFT_708739 [Coprinopsis sp. MPI-PUGE-AT-0042]|nr:hypothetical protein BKA70DRAFT_708739 [Coprinopsis sp. MPI-PUGE-AT-0042]